MVMEDHHLTVKQIAANAGISVGSVDTILHDDLREKRPKKLQRCSFITTTLLLIERLMFPSYSTTTTLKVFSCTVLA
jgi:hypothetical protein